MNVSRTQFGAILTDFLETISFSFPDCKQTRDVLTTIRRDPRQLDTIQLDWARHVSPYDIHQYQHVFDYFVAILANVPKHHLFHQLTLFEKYESFGKDTQAKDDFCLCLADLQKYALDDTSTLGGESDGSIIVEEPTTPPGHTGSLDSSLNHPPAGQLQSKSHTTSGVQPNPNRFDDEELHELCVEKTGDRKFVEQLREFSRKFPILTKQYGKDTNEAIANRLVQMRPILKMLLTMLSPMLQSNDLGKANTLIEGVMKRFDPNLK